MPYQYDVDALGILQYLSNNSSNELLMIGIALVKNSAKPTIFGTGDSDEHLKSSSFELLFDRYSKLPNLTKNVDVVLIRHNDNTGLSSIFSRRLNLALVVQ